MPLEEVLADEDAARGMLDLSILLWEKVARESEDGLSAEEKVVLDLTWIDTQVQNGGWLQWMYNTTIESLGRAVAALADTNSREVHRLAVAALSVPAINADQDTEEIKERKLDRLTEAELESLHELDTQFYDTMEDFMASCKAFAISHRESFRI